MGSFLSKHMSSSRFNTKTPNDRDIMDTPLQRDMVGSGGPHVEDEDPKIKTVKLDNVTVSAKKNINYTQSSDRGEIKASYNPNTNITKYTGTPNEKGKSTTVYSKNKPHSGYKIKK